MKNETWMGSGSGLKTNPTQAKWRLEIAINTKHEGYHEGKRGGRKTRESESGRRGEG